MAVYSPITPSDTVAFSPPVSAIWVGQAGDLAVLGETDAVAVTLRNVPVGLLRLPYEVSRVMSTNTTAGLLVGCAV
jgi:hypothetical protein